MENDPGPSVMRRLAKPVVAPPPLTSTRALRLAMVRAAEVSIALPLSVLGIRDEEGPLDDLLDRLEDELMILALHDGQGPAGLVALDAEARAAAIEVQALGRVSPTPVEPRAPTTADAALARPLLSAFLHEAEQAMTGSPLAGWLKGARLGDRLPSPREAALLLSDGSFRAIRLSLDLGAGGRQGLLVLLLRLAPPAPLDATPDLSATVADRVMEAAVAAEAVLHRIRLSFPELEALHEGQVLPLPGVTLSSVHLMAGGHDLGSGRLGQVAGMRAVRIGQAMTSPLEELATIGAGLSDPASAPGSGLLPAPGLWDPSQSDEAPPWGPPEVAPIV